MNSEPGSNRPAWQAETIYPELCELLRSSLSEVYDPEIHLSVIQLGLVRDLIIEDNKAHLKMILTTIYCPYAPHLMEQTRSRAEEALQMPVDIELGMEMWDYSMMEDGAGADWGFF
jgi:metal-sulfur cluster biosynthetic enzyme